MSDRTNTMTRQRSAMRGSSKGVLPMGSSSGNERTATSDIRRGSNEHAAQASDPIITCLRCVLEEISALALRELEAAASALAAVLLALLHPAVAGEVTGMEQLR